MKDFIQYIIRFLLGDDIPSEYIPAVGYTDDPQQYDQFSIVIHPSGFFDPAIYGSRFSIPQLPLKSLGDIPLLFGEPSEEMVGDTLVLQADLVASTYFLITRYEEMVSWDVRDVHGRFPGRLSLPYRAGFLHRPIIEEYSLYLRNKLRRLGAKLPNERQGIRQVNLTHDVDAPFYCRSWRNVLREAKNGQNIFSALKNKAGKLENDPYYTFPWILKENERAQAVLGKTRCKTICFFKAGGNTAQDRPVYNLTGKDMKSLFLLCREHQVEIGLHSSYQAGKDPEKISKEKKRLEAATGNSIRINRHHFLASREPEHMVSLLKAGIDQDYTLGYADVAGFRLGTCRAVRWIDPVTQKLTSLTLHPLTMMECSLSEKKYMGLSYADALAYSSGLIDQTAKYGGELTLLWHNTAFSIYESGYLKQLYTDLINKLTNA